MPVYFAPLEGVTDVVFRRLHHAQFPGVAKYFIPFISPTQHMTFSSREQRAVSPEENAGIPAVPQILTKDAEHFLMTAKLLADAGFTEINLNLGCPSGTVTAKGKGSGMLRDPDALRAFLDRVCEGCPLPVSVKTRIGFSSCEEWGALLELLNEYPLSELIVHPRTRKEFYRGTPHREVLSETVRTARMPLVYNGDLFTAEDCAELTAEYPSLAALMIGRGLIANPALERELRGGERLKREELKFFHDSILEEYAARWQAKAALAHMHELMYYMVCCFEDADKPYKAVRKSNTLAAYREAADRIFADCPMRETPGFLPPDGTLRKGK